MAPDGESVEVTAANRPNYGDWVTQYRRVDEDTWREFARASHSTASVDVALVARSYLVAGARYAFRTYHRTEHVIGGGCQPTTFVIPLQDPSNLAVDSTTITSIDLSWTDNSIYQTVDRFELEMKQDNELDDWATVETVAPGTTSATANGLTPGSSYRFRVAIYGESYVGYSDVLVASTEDPGVPSQSVPPTGWHVVVEHPSGRQVVPSVIGSPNWEPEINGYPEVRVPVPRSERWLETGWEGAEMKCWYNGTRLPIDEVQDFVVGPEQLTLVGRGGLALEQDVTRQYVERPVHEAAHDLIESAGLEANVDAPTASTSEGITLTRATSTDQLSELVGDIPADTPVGVSGGRVRLLQSCWWFQDTDLFDASETQTTLSTTDGSCVSFTADNSGLEGETTVTPDYDVPAGKFAVRATVEGDPGNQFAPAFELLVDGESVWSALPTSWSNPDETRWIMPDPAALDRVLEGGREHTIAIRNRGGGDGYSLLIDAVTLFDTRYSYDFDEFVEIGQSQYLAGPQLYPDAVDVSLGEVAAGRLVRSAEVSADFDNRGGAQSLGISADGGQTWTDATNSESVSADFADPSTTLQLRATLSRHGLSSGSAPATGDEGQTLTNLRVTGVLESTPTLIGNAFEGSVMSVLQEMADFGDYIFEIRRDGGSYSVEWTTPGQRTSARSEPLTDYSVDKVTSEQFDRVVVRGTSVPGDETFVASVGSWVDLLEDYLTEGKTRVRDGSTTYESGIDYELRPLTGEVRALSAGALSDGNEYQIEYQAKVTGSYTSAGAGSNPTTRYVDMPNANTASRCEQLAVTIGDQVDDPYWTADVTIPELPPDLSLVAAISLEDLPLDPGGLEVMTMEQKPESVKLTLGSRSPLEETIARLRKQLAATTAKV